MPYNFHKDKETYFNIQYRLSKNYIVSYVDKHIKLDENCRVLEIGCAEAGVLKAFTDLGCKCTGIELSAPRVEMAKDFMNAELKAGKIDFITKNIYDIDAGRDLRYKYDLIILKDVIEHIHDQDVFIPKLKEFLNPGGIIFFSFPPWYMPFGGHQQMCDSKLLGRMPYIHLLPLFLYKFMLKLFGEPKQRIMNLAELKKTGISIERFENIVKSAGYQIVSRRHYLTNPIYEYKFNLKVRRQVRLLARIPYIRDFMTTAVYYLVKSK